MEGVKFTYVIVSKRINTRFFRNGGKASNPPSGTIVDDVVTLPERYLLLLMHRLIAVFIGMISFSSLSLLGKELSIPRVTMLLRTHLV